MNIRPYQDSDEDAVVQLWIECGLVASRNNPIRDIERKLQVNPEWFLIGEETGRIMASCMAGYEGHRGWINYLAVSPDQQGRGYATSLMREAERLIREAGCPKINLQVRSSNSRVISFYETLGFVEDNVMSLGKRLEVDEPFTIPEEDGSTS